MEATDDKPVITATYERQVPLRQYEYEKWSFRVEGTDPQAVMRQLDDLRADVEASIMSPQALQKWAAVHRPAGVQAEPQAPQQSPDYDDDPVPF